MSLKITAADTKNLNLCTNCLCWCTHCAVRCTTLNRHLPSHAASFPFIIPQRLQVKLSFDPTFFHRCLFGFFSTQGLITFWVLVFFFPSFSSFYFLLLQTELFLFRSHAEPQQGELFMPGVERPASSALCAGSSCQVRRECWCGFSMKRPVHWH